MLPLADLEYLIANNPYDAYNHLFSYETKYTNTYGYETVTDLYESIIYYQTEFDNYNYERTVDDEFKNRIRW